MALTQKDAALKATRKDLAAAKAQVAQLKAKNKDLKQQLDEIPSRPIPQGKAGPPRRQQLQSQQPGTRAPTQQQVATGHGDIVETALHKKLAEIDGLDKMLKETKKVSELETQITDCQLQISKVENWNYALSQQLDEAKSMLEQAEEKINELMREKKELAKARGQAQSSSEKALRDHVKSLSAELEKVRQEWSSPEQVAAQLEQTVSLTAQVKSLQAEISRKAKTLGHVRQ